MMRIELFGAAAVTAVDTSSGGALRPTQQSAQGGATTVPVDTASLSTGGVSASSLTSQALSAAPARLAKVQTLRHAVANAEYSVDPALVAEAMIGEYL